MPTLCDNCKKNKYSVLVTKSMNGEKTNLHLCYQCSLEMQSPLFLNSLFSSILKIGEAGIQKGPVCKGCGFTIDNLQKKSKVGCATCYTTFNRELTSIMENIQWGMQHKGKIPQQNEKDLITKKEIKELRKKLDRAVSIEEYEEAARLRDQIKEMEGSELS